MANSSNKEPSTAPHADRWYNLTLSSSFTDNQPSAKYCTLRYEFKPASIDKNRPGILHKNKDNRVTVEFDNNQHGKPKVTFEGSSEDYKENDAVLFFDGETFRLERLHRAVKRLRHVRLPGESVAAATAPASVGPSTEASSPPIDKPTKFQSLNKGVLHSMPVEVERIEIGEFKNSDVKPRNEKAFDYPVAPPNPPSTSPESKNDDLEEQLDILNDDDDDVDVDVGEAANRGNLGEMGFHIGTDKNDTDDEIADVDVSDDEADKGRNAAEALRAQVNAEEKQEPTSSSSVSSGSESSGSDSGSGSGSGSGSSSSDSESSDGDSVHSI